MNLRLREQLDGAENLRWRDLKKIVDSIFNGFLHLVDLRLGARNFSLLLTMVRHLVVVRVVLLKLEKTRGTIAKRIECADPRLRMLAGAVAVLVGLLADGIDAGRAGVVLFGARIFDFWARVSIFFLKG
jgi:hypothetical protein